MAAACGPTASVIQTAIAQTQIALPTTTPGPTVSPQATPTQLPPPLTNSVYFGVAEGVNAIFVTENRHQELLKSNGFESSSYLGSLFYEPGYQMDVFNFKDLMNPKLLFSFPELVEWGAVKYGSSPSGIIYLSGTRKRDTFPIFLSFIEAVDLKTGENREIWSGAPGRILYVYNEFLEIAIFYCFACDSAHPPRTMILNTATGKTLELGDVGNVVVDVDQNTVTYQYLAQVEVPCTPDIQCKGVSYEPRGEVLVKTLP
jgi:hypothetical protein